MSTLLRWVIATLGWLLLLFVYVIWKSYGANFIIDNDIALDDGRFLMAAFSGGLRGLIVFGGAFYLYKWARNGNRQSKQQDNESALKQSALMKACANGNITQVRELLKNGAQVNYQDEQGETALMHAVKNDQSEIIDLLMDKGADSFLVPGFQPRLRLSALMQACANGNITQVRELLKNGAEVNYQDKQGGTALMYAVINDQSEIIDLLLNHGADISMRSKNGKTALDTARSRGLINIVALLEHAECKPSGGSLAA
jgi:hypothetical protein